MCHCREGYKNAEGLQAHVANVAGILSEAFKEAWEMVSVECHGPKSEIEKLMADENVTKLNPTFYILDPSAVRRA